MAVATNKTIILTSMPRKMEISTSLSSHMGFPLTRVAESLLNTGPRKRKRLSHLSPEERMTRRKLKNRVAAQTARDRKKQQMSDLEEAVELLQAENDRLQEENEKLLDQTDGLAEENAELRQRLGLPAGGVVSGKTQVSQESAALVVPQQKGQGPVILQLISQYLALMITFSLTSCMDSSRTSYQRLRSLPLTNSWLKRAVVRNARHLQWWGPQQKSWNPSKNLFTLTMFITKQLRNHISRELKRRPQSKSRPFPDLAHLSKRQRSSVNLPRL